VSVRREDIPAILEGSGQVVRSIERFRGDTESGEVNPVRLRKHAIEIHSDLDKLHPYFAWLRLDPDLKPDPDRFRELEEEFESPEKARAVAEFAAAVSRSLAAAGEVVAVLSFAAPVDEAFAATGKPLVAFQLANMDADGEGETGWDILAAFRDEDERFRLALEGRKVFELGPPGGQPVIHGEVVRRLTKNRYQIIKALREAGTAGLSLDELIRASGAERPDRSLGDLLRFDPTWEKVVVMPGPGGQGKGYRLHADCF
jgi:hypothetical protein